MESLHTLSPLIKVHGIALSRGLQSATPGEICYATEFCPMKVFPFLENALLSDKEIGHMGMFAVSSRLHMFHRQKGRKYSEGEGKKIVLEQLITAVA